MLTSMARNEKVMAKEFNNVFCVQLPNAISAVQPHKLNNYHYYIFSHPE
jgi:hypothetical protein